MTLYLTWPISSDSAEKRQSYADLTGEYIQDNPQINEEESHYMVGSSRCGGLTESLRALGFDVFNDVPDWWEDKEYELT